MDKCAFCGIKIEGESVHANGYVWHKGKCHRQAVKSGSTFLPFGEDCEPRTVPDDQRTLLEVRKTSRYSREAVRPFDENQG